MFLVGDAAACSCRTYRKSESRLVLKNGLRQMKKILV
jgi:hypothetical protein